MTVEMDVENYGLAFSDDEPVGDDPRYFDEFDVAHSEIGKMAGNDFKLIEQQCRYILLEKSKDLRVAGYLLLALTYLEGINGLMEGLGIYNELLASFGAALHPARASAKASAIKWLNHVKLESFVKKEVIHDSVTYNTIKHQIARLNELLETNLPEIENRFFILNAWLKTQIIEPPKAPSMTQALVGKLLPSKAPKEKPSSNQIETEQDYKQSCRHVFNYCKSNTLRSEAISFSRLVHWSKHFTLPKHNNHQTLVMSIRKEALDEIQRLRNVNEPQKLFNCCESALWDIGGPYLLDLNYYSYCALELLGDTDAIEQLTFYVQQLIKRLPELPYLNFKDDMPFASADTRQWLDGLVAPKPASPQFMPQSNNIKNHVEFIEQAKKQSTTNDVISHLQALKQIPSFSAQETLEKAFAIATLLSGTNHELAMHHYQALLQTIKEQHVDKWLPDLAISILSAYRTLLKTTNGNTTEQSRVTHWLCQLDPCICL